MTLGFAPAFISRTVQAARARQKVLVAIFQRGAVDGLNMVVPFGDKAYYEARPTIAIPMPSARTGDCALDLDGFFGLHPRMAGLEPFFKDGSLAIIHASGSHDETRSHFDAQDYMESGTPGVKSTRDGWLNRYLHDKEHESASPFRAVALAPQLPRSLQGSAPALAINAINQFGIRAGRDTDAMSATFESEYAAAADALLHPAGKGAFEAVKMLKQTNPASYSPANGAEYPRSGFGDAMRQIAQLDQVRPRSRSGVHRARQLGPPRQRRQHDRTDRHRASMTSRTASPHSRRDMGDGMADVVLVTMSEFGRAVQENGNRGTDHGHGNAMLILGGPVKGGKVYGKWPGLQREQRWEGPRPRHHDRLPRCLRRSRDRPSRRAGHLEHLPGLRLQAAGRDSSEA